MLVKLIKRIVRESSNNHQATSLIDVEARVITTKMQQQIFLIFCHQPYVRVCASKITIET